MGTSQVAPIPGRRWAVERVGSPPTLGIVASGWCTNAPSVPSGNKVWRVCSAKGEWKHCQRAWLGDVENEVPDCGCDGIDGGAVPRQAKAYLIPRKLLLSLDEWNRPVFSIGGEEPSQGEEYVD